MDQAKSVTMAHILLLQSAIFALFQTSRDKAALRDAFEAMSEVIFDQALSFSISDEGLENAQKMRGAFLKLLE